MSLLSKYYYKKFMIKTLSSRIRNAGGDTEMTDVSDRSRSRLSLHNETYESAAFGLFASSGEVYTSK